MSTPICVAYLVNQYPKISHVFIRREIQALEALGLRVERFSLRRSRENFVDEADRAELRKTRAVLECGPFAMAYACAAAFVTRPGAFARALAMAVRIGWGSDRGLIRHLAYLVEACVLLRWFARVRVDHVHAHFATNPAAVAMLCRMLGGPRYSFTVHGPDDFDRARSLSLPEKIGRARFVITVSSYGRSQLYRWCDPDQWPKIGVLHPGLDEGFLDLSPVPIPSAPRLVCVGRLAADKGQLLLVEAAGRLNAAGVRCELVLVGDGPLRAQLQARIRDLHLEKEVVLAGAVSRSELHGYIQSARALIAPSFAENLPSVILEAFALHRPAIATFIGGIPEVVEPGLTGWLVPAGSVERLQSAMQEALAASVETLERMGRAAALRARQFRSDDSARVLLEKFQEGE
jgi:glycosyltransferase involved in cell wall biosynthesis